MNNTNNLKNTIINAKNIALISHINPDGDTLGSMIALALGLEKLNIQADMIAMNKIPDVYSFLPSVEKIKSIYDITTDYEVVIALDCGAKDRFTPSQKLFDNAKTTINIDHHITNASYADINIVDTNVSATGEVVFNLLSELNIPLTQEIAINLYTAILTDTGGFKFTNTKPSTFACVSELVKTGINHSEIHESCYENRPLELIKLHAHCIDQAKFIESNKIAYTFVHKKTQHEIGALDEHTEGLAERLRQVNTVEVSFVLKEIEENKTKLSFRSKSVDVSKICEKYNGGGHKLAAGCKIEKSPEQALDEILPIVIQEVENEKGANRL